MEAGDAHAIILAAAGLNRLGLSPKITSILSTEAFLPAIGQGILGVELRKEDQKTKGLLSFLNDENTARAARAERAFLARLGGGCDVPLAGYAQMKRKELHLEGMVAELDGSVILRRKRSGPAERAEELGRGLAEELLAAGAQEILERICGAPG
jgi:hydroxymethylbilane synthase